MISVKTGHTSSPNIIQRPYRKVESCNKVANRWNRLLTLRDGVATVLEGIIVGMLYYQAIDALARVASAKELPQT